MTYDRAQHTDTPTRLTRLKIINTVRACKRTKQTNSHGTWLRIPQLWRPEERSSGVCSVLRAVLYSRMCAQLTLTPWGRPRHLDSVLLYSEIESVPLRESRTSLVLPMQIWVSPPQLSFSAQNTHHWDSCMNMRRRRGHFCSEVRNGQGCNVYLL